MVSQEDVMYTTDEYGRPYVIVRDQGKKARIRGLEAQKVRIM
jgi:T-complex protein 1 subunit epsilon